MVCLLLISRSFLHGVSTPPHLDFIHFVSTPLSRVNSSNLCLPHHLRSTLQYRDAWTRSSIELLPKSLLCSASQSRFIHTSFVPQAPISDPSRWSAVPSTILAILPHASTRPICYHPPPPPHTHTHTSFLSLPGLESHPSVIDPLPHYAVTARYPVTLRSCHLEILSPWDPVTLRSCHLEILSPWVLCRPEYANTSAMLPLRKIAVKSSASDHSSIFSQPLPPPPPPPPPTHTPLFPLPPNMNQPPLSQIYYPNFFFLPQYPILSTSTSPPPLPTTTPPRQYTVTSAILVPLSLPKKDKILDFKPASLRGASKLVIYVPVDIGAFCFNIQWRTEWPALLVYIIVYRWSQSPW